MIVVLIDSGESSNSISAHLVNKLGIQVTNTAPFSPILVNGEINHYQGICKGGGHNFASRVACGGRFRAC